eukprot:g20176.t1
MNPLPMQHGGPKKLLGGIADADEDELLPPPIGAANGNDAQKKKKKKDDDGTLDDGADKAAAAYSAAGYVWAAKFTHGESFVSDRYVALDTPIMETPIEDWIKDSGDGDCQMHGLHDQGSSESRCSQLLCLVMPYVYSFGRAHRISNNIKGLCKRLSLCAGLWSSYMSGPKGSGQNKTGFREEAKELLKVIETKAPAQYLRLPHVREMQRQMNAESTKEAMEKLAARAAAEARITVEEFDGAPATRPATWLGYPGEVCLAMAPLTRDLCQEYIDVAKPHFDLCTLLETLDRTPAEASPFKNEMGEVVEETLAAMRRYLDPAATAESTYTTAELSRLFSERRVKIWQTVFHETARKSGHSESRLAMATVLYQRIVSTAMFEAWDPQFGLLEGMALRGVTVSPAAGKRFAEFFSAKRLPVNAKRMLRCVFTYPAAFVKTVVSTFVKKVTGCQPIIEKLTETQFKSNQITCDKRSATESSFVSKQLDRLQHFERHKRYRAPPPLPDAHLAIPMLPSELDTVLEHATTFGASPEEFRLQVSKKANERVADRRKDSALTDLFTDMKNQQNVEYHQARFANNSKKQNNEKTARNIVQLVATGPSTYKAEHIGFRGAETQALLQDFAEDDEVTPELFTWVRSLSKRMNAERQLSRRLRLDPVGSRQFLRCKETGVVRKLTGWHKDILHMGYTLVKLSGGNNEGWWGIEDIDPYEDGFVGENGTRFVGGFLASGKYELYDGEIEHRIGAIVFGEQIRFLHDRWVDPETFGLDVFPDFSIDAQLGAFHQQIGGGDADTHRLDDVLRLLPQTTRTIMRRKVAALERKAQRRGWLTAFKMKWDAGHYSVAEKTATLSGNGALAWWNECDKKAAASMKNVDGPGKGAGKKKNGSAHQDANAKRHIPDHVFRLHQIHGVPPGDNKAAAKSKKVAAVQSTAVCEFRTFRKDGGSSVRLRIHWLNKYKTKRVRMHPSCEVTGDDVVQKLLKELLPYALKEFQIGTQAECMLTDDANKKSFYIPPMCFAEVERLPDDAGEDFSDDEDDEDVDDEGEGQEGSDESDPDDDEDDDADADDHGGEDLEDDADVDEEGLSGDDDGEDAASDADAQAGGCAANAKNGSGGRGGGAKSSSSRNTKAAGSSAAAQKAEKNAAARGSCAVVASRKERSNGGAPASKKKANSEWVEKCRAVLKPMKMKAASSSKAKSQPKAATKKTRATAAAASSAKPRTSAMNTASSSSSAAAATGKTATKKSKSAAATRAPRTRTTLDTAKRAKNVLNPGLLAYHNPAAGGGLGSCVDDEEDYLAPSSGRLLPDDCDGGFAGRRRVAPLHSNIVPGIAGPSACFGGAGPSACFGGTAGSAASTST